MKKMIVFCFFVLLAWNDLEIRAQQVHVMFYNVENLFDLSDDSLTRDEEFLPGADRKWNFERFHRKIIRIYQTLVAAGEGEMPAVVGLCEIENREVLEKLVYETPLSRMDYRIIHRDSPDARGVDVALLYRKGLFFPDSSEWLQVPMPSNETTREILHVEGRLWEQVPVHIYVNHWPSRYGGAGGSAGKRIAAASMLAVSVKEILQSDPLANIIIMGDFNDEPGDESLQALIKIISESRQGEMQPLVNLSAKTSMADFEGTIKHQGVWSVFDQILVSGALFEGKNGCCAGQARATVFSFDFLLEPDETYTGFKPFRTFLGPGYHNGFSDHLPVGVLIRKIE